MRIMTRDRLASQPILGGVMAYMNNNYIKKIQVGGYTGRKYNKIRQEVRRREDKEYGFKDIKLDIKRVSCYN